MKVATVEADKMETNQKSFKKMFPNLSKELEVDQNKVQINSVRVDPCEAEQSVSDTFRHYTPTVQDFIRRCDTKAQAEEIISFMEKKGELTKEQAGQLRTQLKKKGLRSFGSKKEENYYFKHGGLF
jgi:hypothetical protein